MKKLIKLFVFILLAFNVTAQGVGIGTTTPNTKAILELNSISKGFLPTRLNNTQMNSIFSPPVGMVIFNTELRSLMTYTQKGWLSTFNNSYIPVNGWLPLSTGPRVIAWGTVDSIGPGSGDENSSHPVTVLSGSGNFSFEWQGGDRKWYLLSMTNVPFDLDSMILQVTPIGNGSWDKTVTVSQFEENNIMKADIKFIDISRMVDKWPQLDVRRRSKFSFVLYSTKKVTF